MGEEWKTDNIEKTKKQSWLRYIIAAKIFNFFGSDWFKSKIKIGWSTPEGGGKMKVKVLVDFRVWQSNQLSE